MDTGFALFAVTLRIVLKVKYSPISGLLYKRKMRQYFFRSMSRALKATHHHVVHFDPTTTCVTHCGGIIKRVVGHAALFHPAIGLRMASAERIWNIFACWPNKSINSGNLKVSTYRRWTCLITGSEFSSVRWVPLEAELSSKIWFKGAGRCLSKWCNLWR